MPNTYTHSRDIPPHLKLLVIKALLQNLDAQLTTLRPPLHRVIPMTIQLHHKLMLANTTVQDGQHRVTTFFSVVDYSFNLWTHLQKPSELNALDDIIYAIEVKVTQQKSNLASLPPKEHATTMIAIASRTKEVTTTRDEQ
jgi:hypothetical protein